MATTYEFNIENFTKLEYTYTIKIPNIPSPVALPESSRFPAFHTCTIPPGKDNFFKTDIPSDSPCKI
jgi:hypothetical protein